MALWATKLPAVGCATTKSVSPARTIAAPPTGTADVDPAGEPCPGSAVAAGRTVVGDPLAEALVAAEVDDPELADDPHAANATPATPAAPTPKTVRLARRGWGGAERAV
jgi:hypothetical protein